MSKIKYLFGIALFALLIPATSAQADSHEPVIWWAEYFDNPTLHGRPIRAIREATIDHDWGLNAPLPEVPADKFSVRWSTDLHLDAGEYTFMVTVDDGARLWVDGKLIIDAWRAQKATTFTKMIYLDGGQHSIQLAYFDQSGAALVKLWWRLDKPGEKEKRDYGKRDEGHKRMSGDVMLVDNTDYGFTWGGPAGNKQMGHGGHHGFYFTKNTTYQPENWGKWSLKVGQAGMYEVFAFIPSNHATTASVRYRILHNGERHDKVIDQDWYFDQWISLGTYHFSGQSGEAVVLYDNTHETAYSTFIAFDAIKLVKRH